jgi:hypothetical protein
LFLVVVIEQVVFAVTGFTKSIGDIPIKNIGDGEGTRAVAVGALHDGHRDIKNSERKK